MTHSHISFSDSAIRLPTLHVGFKYVLVLFFDILQIFNLDECAEKCIISSSSIFERLKRHKAKLPHIWSQYTELAIKLHYLSVECANVVILSKLPIPMDSYGFVDLEISSINQHFLLLDLSFFFEIYHQCVHFTLSSPQLYFYIYERSITITLPYETCQMQHQHLECTKNCFSFVQNNTSWIPCSQTPPQRTHRHAPTHLCCAVSFCYH